HVLSAGDRRQNNFGSPQFLQFGSSVLRLAINVILCAEFFRERLLVFAPGDANSVEAHFRGELNAHVAEAPDSQDGDEVSRSCAAVSQGIKCRDAGAKQRPCLYCGKLVWNHRESPGGGNHVIRVTSVAGQARDLPAPAARYEITSAAGVAIAAMPSVPADSDSLP